MDVETDRFTFDELLVIDWNRKSYEAKEFYKDRACFGRESHRESQ